jgi:hypothetical protein
MGYRGIRSWSLSRRACEAWSGEGDSFLDVFFWLLSYDTPTFLGSERWLIGVAGCFGWVKDVEVWARHTLRKLEMVITMQS